MCDDCRTMEWIIEMARKRLEKATTDEDRRFFEEVIAVAEARIESNAEASGEGW